MLKTVSQGFSEKTHYRLLFLIDSSYNLDSNVLVQSQALTHCMWTE